MLLSPQTANLLSQTDLDSRLLYLQAENMEQLTQLNFLVCFAGLARCLDACLCVSRSFVLINGHVDSSLRTRAC